MTRGQAMFQEGTKQMFTLEIILYSLSALILAQQAEKTEQKEEGANERNGEKL